MIRIESCSALVNSTRATWTNGTSQLQVCKSLLLGNVPKIHPKASSGSRNIYNSWRCNTLDMASSRHLQSLRAKTSKLGTVPLLKVQMSTCLSLDVILEVFDISVNETGRLIQTNSLLPGSVLTSSSTFITKQWSTAQKDQGQKKPVIHKQCQMGFP